MMLLETLLVLNPTGGAYVTQTYENLIARAEDTLANFAYDHNISGEHNYIQQLLETERTCDLSQYSSQQIRSYFTLLIVGLKVPGSTCKGFSVSPKSRDPQDHARVEVMKEKAMLEIKDIRTTRNLVDWVITYLTKMRKAVSAMEAFQGKTSGTIAKVGGANRGRQTPASGSTTGGGYDPTEEAILVLKASGPQQFSEPPCKGCGTLYQHRTADLPALTQQQCPMRSHPDWNAENIPFADSTAGKRMSEQNIPFVNHAGVETTREPL
jgi:hypothetical protein